jgi:hypothetical protein
MALHHIGGKEVSLQTEVNLDDTAPYRVFYEIEPYPNDQGLIQRVIDNHKFYNLILTWRERILHACPNAINFLYAGPYLAVSGNDLIIPAHVGLPTPDGISRWVSTLHPAKKFAASFITSSKDGLPGHIFRQQVFSRLPEVIGSCSLPIQKHRSCYPAGHLSEVDRGRFFTEFQYHIAAENCQFNNWMTEKLFDCFMARTIPIYWGCPNLGEYFNLDGVIRVNTCDDVIQALQNITPDTYAEKSAAIEDNFNRCVAVYCQPNRLGAIIEENL